MSDKRGTTTIKEAYGLDNQAQPPKGSMAEMQHGSLKGNGHDLSHSLSGTKTSGTRGA